MKEVGLYVCYVCTGLVAIACFVGIAEWLTSPPLGKSNEEIARELANEQYATYQTAIAINELDVACYALNKAIMLAIDTHDVEYAKGIKGTYEMNCKG